jgi:hypothetical protein
MSPPSRRGDVPLHGGLRSTARFIDKAIEAIRAINAAEYDYRADHGCCRSWVAVYAFDWRTLGSLDSGLTTRRGQRQTWIESTVPGDEVIPGYRLTLLVADDGMAYSISLHDMKSNGCGLSIFSDQSGLIYRGTVVGCPQIVDGPRRDE